jgi:predicted acetyltransferase
MAAYSVEVVPAAREHAPILANLLELYVHDFSDFYDVQIGEDGRFGYNALPRYWSEPGWHPLLIRVDGKLAGLALVQSASGVWDMAEFFVLRAYRRRGVGTEAAHEVCRRFPGRWDVRVMEANVAGQHFWTRAISMFAGATIKPMYIQKSGVYWSIFSFESKGIERSAPTS